MRKTLWLWLALLLATAASGQHLRASEELEMGRESRLQIIGKQADKVMLFGRNRGDFFVAAYGDTSLQMLWKKEIKLPSQSEFPLVFVSREAEFLAIYAQHERGETLVRAMSIDTSGAITSDSVLFSLSDRYTLDRENFTLSEDRQWLGFAMPALSKRLHLAMVNLDSRALRWQLEEKIEDTDPMREYIGFLTSNAGGMYLFFNQNTSRKQAKDHHIRMIELDSSHSIKHYLAPMPDVYMQSALVGFDERHQQAIVAGFSGTESNITNGMFYLRLQPQKYDSGEGVSFKNTLYEPTFLRSVTASRRKTPSGIPNLQAESLILRQDGGCILVGEQVTVKNYELAVNTFPSAPQNVRQQADYWLGNVVIAAIHPDGSPHWLNVLHKNQNSENDFGRFSSFLLLKTPSALRFLYNQEVYSGTPLYEFSIDALGKSGRLQLAQKFTRQNIKFKKGLQTGADEAYVLAEHYYRHYLLRISYP